MTSKNKPLTEDQIAEAMAAFVAGETCLSIGLRMDRSESAISALMNRRGLKRGNTPSRFQDPAFLALRRAGRSAREIAREMGINAKTVEWWIVQALKAGLIEKAKARRPWPQEQADRLARLWADMGPAQISQETGWSVKVIEAKARRMGLERKSYPRVRKPVVGRKVTHRRPTAAETQEAREARREAAREARRAAVATLWTPSDTSRPFLERGAGQCSWPLGDGVNAHACCAPVEGRDSYCPHHRMIAGGGPREAYAGIAYGRTGGRSVFGSARP